MKIEEIKGWLQDIIEDAIRKEVEARGEQVDDMMDVVEDELASLKSELRSFSGDDIGHDAWKEVELDPYFQELMDKLEKPSNPCHRCERRGEKSILAVQGSDGEYYLPNQVERTLGMAVEIWFCEECFQKVNNTFKKSIFERSADC